MTDPVPVAEITTTTWRTKAFNAWQAFYAWAKLHPGIMIPATAYLAGIATTVWLRWMLH